MRNMVLSIGLAALAMGVEANDPAGEAAALVTTVNGVSACYPWGCGLNSPIVESATVVTSRPIWNCGAWGCGGHLPIVDGVATVAPTSQARPARRHQAAQIAHTDVLLDEAGNEAHLNRIRDSRNMRTAVCDSRFGEAHTSTASSLKNGPQLTPSQSKVLVMPLQEQRFGEAWGKNLNSPVIDGAAIL